MPSYGIGCANSLKLGPATIEHQNPGWVRQPGTRDFESCCFRQICAQLVLRIPERLNASETQSLPAAIGCDGQSWDSFLVQTSPG